ncbi:hypothetical protein E2A64_10305 [Pseudohoeflea suaedae]|uniref:DUF2190 family protein n=1 Tax=Pseudohoeflea suaedae TaxID=877384 RepID=A0A4R5PJ95_9HYPH|nr:hypothetical protein [Pseudohoeflea suaedae]TDH35719.1 hypothetical protein E2A64_10305 [Pseudohoeflea suaedae]
MADLTITAANVVSGANAKITHGTAGETITAGQVVYLDSTTTGRWLLADTDSATAAVRAPGGIALNGASDGQPLAVQESGQITIGATIAAGVAYYLSGTAGAICPVADVASGDYPAIIGIGLSTSVLDIKIVAPNVQLA